MIGFLIIFGIVIAELAIMGLCICSLLRQIARALNYQNVEITHQVIFLRKIATHSEMSRLYLMHILRRTRALQEVKHDDLETTEQKTWGK